MNLIQMAEKVQEIENQRNQLLGQKEMVLNNLKELGFASISKAKTALISMKKEITKMEEHYETGKTSFKKQYGHLLR